MGRKCALFYSLRQDLAQIIAALILNVAPSLDRSVRGKRYTRGLVLWSTLLSIIPQHEGRQSGAG
jgi:hypothetical protein